MQSVQTKPKVSGKHAVAQASRRNPRAEIEYQKGLAESQREHWPQAAAAFERAARMHPEDAVFWLNLANARVKLGDLENAADAARRAIAIDPHSELAVAIASQCLAAANRHVETVEMLQRLDLDGVESPSPHFALGEAYAALDRYQDAIHAFLAALRRKPDFMPAHVHLGNVFERMKLHVEARECFQTAVAVGGNRAELTSAMAYQAQHACRWDLVDQDLQALEAAFDAGLHNAAPFQLLTMPSTRAQQRAAGYAHWLNRAGTVAPMPPLPPRTASGARDRIRIGYCTNDIFRHATAYLIAEVLEQHDRERFDIFLYSFGHDDGSPIRRRVIEGVGAGYVEAREMSDTALADRMRADDLDILVDLKGYTAGSRSRIFALHPARIQVNYLGYPGTTGSPAYEYIVGDRTVTPIEHAGDYSEKIAQMPHCYQPNDRRRPIGPRPTRTACGLPEEGFVFCSFNSCYKITAQVFDRWCRLLRQVEGSVLWLYETNNQAKANLLREAQERGITPERIILAPHVDLPEHLGRLQLADLALDTLPVNAHTTASDALWAGVPMITTAGESFVSRVATSVLLAGGMSELVAADGQAYETLALDLARNPDRLRRLRGQVAANRDTCTLFDSASYTRDLEALFARMFERHAAGLPPDHLLI